jgi:methylase of polypeptide subunit release factors
MEVTPWSSISEDQYPLVVGNPPWVRTERRDTTLTDDQKEYFAEIGEGTNYYGLFLYRAGRTSFLYPPSMLVSGLLFMV